MEKLQLVLPRWGCSEGASRHNHPLRPRNLSTLPYVTSDPELPLVAIVMGSLLGRRAQPTPKLVRPKLQPGAASFPATLGFTAVWLFAVRGLVSSTLSFRNEFPSFPPLLTPEATPERGVFASTPTPLTLFPTLVLSPPKPVLSRQSQQSLWNLRGNWPHPPESGSWEVSCKH